MDLIKHANPVTCNTFYSDAMLKRKPHWQSRTYQRKQNLRLSCQLLECRTGQLSQQVVSATKRPEFYTMTLQFQEIFTITNLKRHSGPVHSLLQYCHMILDSKTHITLFKYTRTSYKRPGLVINTTTLWPDTGRCSMYSNFWNSAVKQHGQWNGEGAGIRIFTRSSAYSLGQKRERHNSHSAERNFYCFHNSDNSSASTSKDNQATQPHRTSRLVLPAN